MLNRYRKSTLKNGVRVLTESFPQSHAVNVGVFVLTGTRDEPRGLEGISHLLEHMVFKGTKSRTPLQIAMSLEAVGGELNAYTTKEYTCYHTLTLKDHLELSVDILSDLAINASFPANEFDREKSVVMQELSMSFEDYSESIYDSYLAEAFSGHKTGVPILGTEKSLQKMSRKNLIDYYKDHHYGKNLIVTATGCVDHDQFVEMVESKLAKVRTAGVKNRRTKPKIKPVRQLIHRPSEQLHLLLGLPIVSYKHPRRFDAYLVNTLMGGGMTSRLYQKIREKWGLAYSVYGYMYSFVDFAMNFYYVGTDKKNMKKSLEVVYKELKRLKEKGIRKKELELFKTQIRGHILLNMDDLESRMTSLAHNEMIFGKHRSIEDIIKEVDAISMDSVHDFLENDFPIDEVGVSLLGQFTENETYQDQKLYL